MANTTLHRMVIAPFILGQYFSDRAVHDHSVRNENDAALFSASIGENGAGRINAFLDAIGPKHSPSGRFSLGYTLNLPLMRYFKKIDGLWQLQFDILRHNIRTIIDVDRDVVIYLSANHFTDANEELVRELAADPKNLMWGRDGPLPPDDYFNHMIVSWTLSDFDAPITKMRAEAFRAALSIIQDLPAEARARIVSISVLGEVHDMFPNFVQGPSQTLSMTQLTDYSPIARNGFHHWLQGKFTTIENLNAAIGGNFADFEHVEPPHRDANHEAVTSRFEHVDLYAAGKASIYGWLYDRIHRPVAVDVYVDGILQGEAETGLSRTDVTDASEEIGDPNVGFRFDLDYRNLAAGSHLIDVVVRPRASAALHMQRIRMTFRHDLNDTAGDVAPVVDVTKLYQSMAFDPSLMGYVDGPATDSVALYNPLARLWLEYRNIVVRNYFEYFANILTDGGIDPHIIFSHQMAPNLYGAWNSDLIALDAMQKNPARYNHGITLYGGTAFGRPVDSMAQRLGWGRYGVNEVHPIVPLEPEDYENMFEHHYRNGAAFMAPYYMSIIPDRLGSGSDLDKYLISKNNHRCGSNLYWESIVSIMKK